MKWCNSCRRYVFFSYKSLLKNPNPAPINHTLCTLARLRVYKGKIIFASPYTGLVPITYPPDRKRQCFTQLIRTLRVVTEVHLIAQLTYIQTACSRLDQPFLCPSPGVPCLFRGLPLFPACVGQDPLPLRLATSFVTPTKAKVHSSSSSFILSCNSLSSFSAMLSNK